MIHLIFMKSNKEALEIILDIEKEISVDKIEFKGIKIWPLIRLELWKILQNGSGSLTNTHQPAFFNRWVKFKKRILIYKEFFFNKFKKRFTKTEAVFLIAPNERRVKIEGKYYSQFSNSVQELLWELDIPSVTLDLARKNLPVYGETNFVDTELLMRARLRRIKKMFWQEEGLNKYWQELKDFLVSKYPDIKITKKNIESLAQVIIDYEKIFERILKKIEPKVCFLACYYHPAAMGYIQAARKLGIKTIEIQHSQQDLNAMYAPWTKLPKTGYSLLPSHWWCWGDKSAININTWSKKIYPEHKAIVGGNPWVAKNMASDYKIDYPDTGKLDEILKNKINVLVALQPIEPVLPTNLLDAVGNSSPNINWLIRLHPALFHQAEKIKSQLQNTGNKNIEIKYSSETPLFNLLKKVDFLITCWSSIAYEALSFKVHPIIIHKNGADLFESYINAKLFSFAHTGEKILNVINKDKSSFNFKEDSPYMETDREKMKKIILDLLGKEG